MSHRAPIDAPTRCELAAQPALRRGRELDTLARFAGTLPARHDR